MARQKRHCGYRQRDAASFKNGIGSGNDPLEGHTVKHAKRCVMSDEKDRLVTSGFAQLAEAGGPGHLCHIDEADEHELEPVEHEQCREVPS